MRRLAIFLGGILFLGIFSNTVSAYNITYETFGPLIYETPSVCILEPNLGIDVQTKNWVNEAKYAASEWEVQLKEKERLKEHKSNWEINIIEIPLSQQESYNYQNCFVIILFEYKPPKNLGFVGGTTAPLEWDENRSLITVYTAGVGVCKSEDDKYIYYDPCHIGVRTTQEIGTIVRHEFGHALGLGHYTSDDDKINEDWARGQAPSPSIMTNFLYEMVKEQQIRPLDVDKVREIYGENGFKNTQKETKEETIPGWVRNNAKWFAEGSISESDFTEGIEYMIKQGIMKVPNLPQQSSAITETRVPEWVKNNAKWWSEGQISDEDFVKGIQYLVENGIIRV